MKQTVFCKALLCFAMVVYDVTSFTFRTRIVLNVTVLCQLRG